MRALIVESIADLALLWQRHMERHGVEARVATTADAAVDMISQMSFGVIVLDLVLGEGSALAVADYAQYRQPATALIFVTDTTFFSDGSLFSIIPNVRAFVPTGTPPEDLAALVEHYGTAA